MARPASRESLDPLLSGDPRRSSVASVLREARASLREPSRPFTPRDASRRLFQSLEYAQRPPSAIGAPSGREFAQAAGLRGTLKPLKPLPPVGVLPSPLGSADPQRPPSANGLQRPPSANGLQRPPSANGLQRPPSANGRPPSARRGGAGAGAAPRAPRADDAAPPTAAAAEVLDLDAERRAAAAAEAPARAAPAPRPRAESDSDPRRASWRANVRRTVAALNVAADGGDEGGMLEHCETLGVLVEQGKRNAEWLGWITSPLYADAGSDAAPPACDEDAHGPCRAAMQRVLFRVVEAPRPVLLLRACRCILSIAGDPREAVVALKTIYKLSKEERHDVPMRRERLLQPLLSLVCTALPTGAPLEGMSAPLPPEALVYAAGALKNSSASDEGNQKALLKLGAVASLCEALLERATAELQRQEAQAAPKSREKALEGIVQATVQVAAILRNLAGAAGGLRAFQGAPVAEALSAMVAAHPDFAELALNTCRVLSRLTSDHVCRMAMERCAGLAPCLLAAMKAHPGNAPLVARAAYVLGNLTMECTDDERRRIGTDHGGAGIVSALVHRYATALAEEASSRASLAPSSTTGDALVKLLRVLANLSMDGSVGERVAKSTIVASALLDIVARHGAALSGGGTVLEEELALNAAAAVTNLSYWHASPENALLGKHAAEAPGLLLPLLLSGHNEAVLEAVRALGNCFRRADARAAGGECRCDEALILLLDHAHREVAFHACGALVNLAADAVRAERLAECGAAAQLGDLLVRAALAEPRPDAVLACVAGKALYNSVALVAQGADVGASPEELGEVCRCLQIAEERILNTLAESGQKTAASSDSDDGEAAALSELLSLSKRLRELLVRRGANLEAPTCAAAAGAEEEGEGEEGEESDSLEELPMPPSDSTAA